MLRKFSSSLILILATAIPLAAFAYTDPGKPNGYMNDFAHVLSADQDHALDLRLAALEQSTGDEVVVVTVPSLGGDTVENYAVQLFQQWGIGKKGKDNGLLILVAPNEHEARIEVGYGLEGTVTDIQSGAIIRNVMIPAFKQNEYNAGITGAVDAVSAIITGSPDAAQYSKPDTAQTDSSGGSSFAGIFFFAVIALNVLSGILGRTRSWWLGGVLGAIAGIVIGLIWGIVIGIIAGVILTILGLIFDFIVSRRPPGGGRGGFGGGFPIWPFLIGGRGGSGGGGGGFGGFGGGSSGGGGASGRW